ncbi:hypothetical protein RHS01_00134 [Rhizoctonia solani]|uniref:Uncharacterized protein n=1 Tax=Rhizoctonia solani TaxID=456999 RepID=A0A8H7M9W7_9AGAM|nr:hypothetical protein RHS01_00134 [Rhizoctonia solani]
MHLTSMKTRWKWSGGGPDIPMRNRRAAEFTSDQSTRARDISPYDAAQQPVSRGYTPSQDRESLVRTDIELFLKGELSSTSATPLEIDQLVERSGALFTYASMLVRFVTSGEPQKRLRLSSVDTSASKKHAHLDTLYKQILKSPGQEYAPEDGEKEDIRFVLQTVLVAQEPNSIDIIVILAEINGLERVVYALRSLRNERAGSDFLIKSSTASDSLADASRMQEQLRFNICNLQSSLVNGLSTGDPGRLSVEPVPVLDGGDRYQARDDHGIGTLIKAKDWLVDVGPGREFMTLVEDCLNFFTGLTANSVSRLTPHIYVSSVPSCPSREGATLATWSTPSPVCSVTYDPQGARAPTGCYGGNLSTRNAHGGDLVLGPFEIDVRDLGDDTTATASRGGRLRICSTRNGKILADPFCGDKPYACSTAFSSDGSHAVSASRQNPIRFWNATAVCIPHSTRRQIHSIFGQEDSTIRFVNGSNGAPQQTPFLGSSDGATRTRNVSDGTPATKPLEGPHCPVNSVAISPDGAYATSGSDDATIRILDIDDGTPFAGPFSGHTNKVHSVTYSNDGTRVISGSLYHTVRVWNFSKGLILPRWFEDQMSDTQTAIFFGPIQNVNQRYPIIEHGLGAEYRVCQRHCRAVQGHPDTDTTASFSHADARLATASEDRTVRVCSIESGELASGPFTGRTDEISSHTRNQYYYSQSFRLSYLIRLYIERFRRMDVNVGEWSTSGDSSLLLWLPADLASAPAPHTGLIITGSGSLIIPKQKLLLGKEWTKCYICD